MEYFTFVCQFFLTLLGLSPNLKNFICKWIFFFFNFREVQSIKHSFTENEHRVYSGNHGIDKPWRSSLPSQSSRTGWVQGGVWPQRLAFLGRPTSLYPATPSKGVVNILGLQWTYSTVWSLVTFDDIVWEDNFSSRPKETWLLIKIGLTSRTKKPEIQSC